MTEPQINYADRALLILDTYTQAYTDLHAATNQVTRIDAESRFHEAIDAAAALCAVAHEHHRDGWYRAMTKLADYRVEVADPDTIETYGLVWPDPELLHRRAVDAYYKRP